MSNDALQERYSDRYNGVLAKLEPLLAAYIADLIEDFPRIDRISVRRKEIDSFLKKANRQDDEGDPKYDNPIAQIYDQLAARVVTYYKPDVEPINDRIKEYIPSVEEEMVVPDSETEFDYEGYHHVLMIPETLLTPEIQKADPPTFFELQVSTLFQHAWAEANHNLGYKPTMDLSKEQKRKIAFSAAQAWGADQIFSELYEIVFNN